MQKIIRLIFLLLLSVSCSRDIPPRQVGHSNGIYYWKTVFRLNRYERDFLKKYRIEKLYVRMFDISLREKSDMDGYEVVPVATIRFADPVPENVEVVPTVYFTLDALKESRGKEQLYAEKVMKRVLSMASYHHLGEIREIQVDCDWTPVTRPVFEEFCHRLHTLLNERDIKLSITVRLHQLKEKQLPEADRGVLMLYNTGAFRSFETANSILDCRDAGPYLSKVSTRLPMDFAYPVFSWSLLFREEKFVCILSRSDWSDSTVFESLGHERFRVLQDTLLDGTKLQQDDIIRRELSRPEEIRKIQESLHRSFPDRNGNTILYHLDSLHLSKFTDHDLHQIYCSR